jgi:hypothetical protein
MMEQRRMQTRLGPYANTSSGGSVSANMSNANIYDGRDAQTQNMQARPGRRADGYGHLQEEEIESINSNELYEA